MIAETEKSTNIKGPIYSSELSGCLGEKCIALVQAALCVCINERVTPVMQDTILMLELVQSLHV